MNKPLDYTQLDVVEPAPISSPLTDIDSSGRASNFVGSMLWILIWVLPSSLIIFFAALAFMGAGPAIILVLLSWGGWAFLLKYQQTKYSPHITRLSNFAVSNGFGFKIGLVNEFRFEKGEKGRNMISSARREFKGVLANSQKAVHTAAEISGVITNNHQFAIYNVMDIGRTGINTVFEVTLSGSYPHVLLDANANNLMNMVSNIAHLLGDMQQVSLEGNFDQHFRLFTAADPTSTLQVIEPSIMASMVDYSLKFDVEIVEDRMYLIAPYTEVNSLGMQSFFVAAEQLVLNLDRAPLR